MDLYFLRITAFAWHNFWLYYSYLAVAAKVQAHASTRSSELRPTVYAHALVRGDVVGRIDTPFAIFVHLVVCSLLILVLE